MADNRIGSGINASLGKTDFTPFLRGSMAGSAAIGAGITAAGNSFAKGITASKKKAEEEGQVEANFQMGNEMLQKFGMKPQQAGTIQEKKAANANLAFAFSQGEKQQQTQVENSVLEQTANAFLSSPNIDDKSKQVFAGFFPAMPAGQTRTPEEENALTKQALTTVARIDPAAARLLTDQSQAKQPKISSKTIPVGDEQVTFRTVDGELTDERIATGSKTPQVLTPEQQKAVAQEKSDITVREKTAISRNDAALERVDATLEFASTAETGIRDSNRALELLEQVDTGLLTKITVPLKKLAASVGVEFDDLAQTEELYNILSQNAVAMLSKFPGQISEGEREFVLSVAPNLLNTPEGNRAILKYNNKFLKREKLAAREIRRLRKEKGEGGHKLDPMTVDEKMAEWYDENEIDVPEDQATESQPQVEDTRTETQKREDDIFTKNQVLEEIKLRLQRPN